MRKTLSIISLVCYVFAGGFIGFNLSQEEPLLLLWILGAVFAVIGIVLDIVAIQVQKKNPKLEAQRSSYDFEIHGDIQETVKKIEELLASKKYYPSDYGTEKVFQCGTGVMTARKMLKIEVHDNIMHIDAWISQGMGKAVGVEHNLDSKYYGAIPINQLKKVLEEIKNIL